MHKVCKNCINQNTIACTNCTDFEFFLQGYSPGYTLVKKKCECGAEKVKSNKHSTWCPKHEK